MALTTAQINALNEFSKAETGLKPFSQISGSSSADLNLGTMLNAGTILSNDGRDQFVSVGFKLPVAVTASATVDVPAFVAPAAGQLVSVKFIPGAIWSAGTSVTGQYLLNAYRYNNTPGNLGFQHDAISGVAAGTAAVLPSGSSNALLVVGQTFTITASSTSLTLNSAVALTVTPAVGDYLSINSTSTQGAGATMSNPGIYTITAVGSTYVKATKIWGANPETVTTKTAVASDVAGIRLIRSSEATFSSGDVVGMRIIVPADPDASATDVSALNFAAVFRYRLT